MKILFSTSKSISSPCRTEKFPPPLMRFLRTNTGSRSRRKKTRKTSLFLKRKKPNNSSSPAIEATQEPSSPKVTCIGQVRVRRFESKSSTKLPNTKNCCTNYFCYCCEKPSFCNFSFCKPNFKKWGLFFNCRTVKVRTDSFKFSSKRSEQQPSQITDDRALTMATPPKNALLLTRCRSAPYRSSSLACQFWGSPLKTEYEENRDLTSKSREDQDIEEISDNRDDDLESCAEIHDIYYSKNDDRKREDAGYGYGNGDKKNGDFPKPLMLVRSKSESTKRNLDRIDLELTRFGNTKFSTPHSNGGNIGQRLPKS
ncbi:uncharacterized protein LOC130812860 [Amaranthus tricolor]|uniref:uncharacterized protein LOC130812860 n=1 Tax=Amaranthus tricolor TaxID=29722 RepID=UPI00258619BF|nr:uncharacterized protein LOC130812860 [Amaranthus tricolor]